MKRGVHEIARGCYAWVHDESSWGWSNAGVITVGGRNIAIDSMFTLPLAAEMMNGYRQTGIGDVDVLVLTHHHGDHVYGATALRPRVVLAHAGCADEMARVGPPNPQILTERFPGFDFNGVTYPSLDYVFDSSLTYHSPDGPIGLRYIGPAHTVGDCVVHVERHKVLYAGDLLFYNSTPICMEGSITGWIAALREILTWDVEVFVPGHGPICGRTEVQQCLEYLTRVADEGRAAFEGGQSVEEAVAQFDLKGFSSWANPGRIVGNMSRLYAEMQGQPPTSDIGHHVRQQMNEYDARCATARSHACMDEGA